jgi:hypothetical protein
MLMPTDEQQQARLYGNASAAVEQASGFCDRNPNTCAATGEMWALFVKKAEFAARMAVELARSRTSDSADQGSKRPSGAVRAQPEPRLQSSARGTLTPADLSPAWRGYANRAGT